MNQQFQALKTRELNDNFRTSPGFIGGRSVMTRSVVDMGTEFINAAIGAVRAFSDFNTNNDPHGEHDMGVCEVKGETVMWKIDYYADAEMLYGADEPWNPDASYRVLTIMLARDW